MILDLHRQGLSVTAIARRTGRDPKTVRKYIERGLELPVYGPRQIGRPGKLLPFVDYVRDRLAAFPDLTATRLLREIRERGYAGAYSPVKRFVAAIRPNDGPRPYEVRFETPPGLQAQVDFARFVVAFGEEPGVNRIIWLFSLVLGHSRHIFARFVQHQDLQTLLRCHMEAFEAIGGVPVEILYDRMKTAVTGEDGDGHIVYNRSLLALAQHYGFVESFNGRMRDELLNETLFFDLDDARAKIAVWVADFNTARPHSALGYLTPAAYAANFTATGDRLRNTDQLRQSPIAPPAPHGVIPAEALVAAG